MIESEYIKTKDGKTFIDYLGKQTTINPDEFVMMSDEYYNDLIERYYKKPSIQEVYDQFRDMCSKGILNKSVINRYYIRDLQAKVVIYHNKYSIEEALKCKELVSYIMRYVIGKKKNLKVFTSEDPLVNFETALRLSAIGVASKPSDFPVKSVVEVLRKYNVNNNYYDFSCGWGDRLCGSLISGVNYFGTDPNYLLIDRLKEMYSDYQKANYVPDRVFPKAEFNCQGSEHFIPRYENKMGVAFSSPPYFDLEDYKVGDQSYKEGMNYEQWKNGYFTQTIENIYRYIIEGGYFIINVKSFNGHDLRKDATEIGKAVGFNHLKDEPIVGRGSRVTGSKKKTNEKDGFDFFAETAKKTENVKIDSIEYMMVFRKGEKKVFANQLF